MVGRRTKEEASGRLEKEIEIGGVEEGRGREHKETGGKRREATEGRRREEGESQAKCRTRRKG